MRLPSWHRRPQAVVEHPDALGYRLVEDVLLDVMPATEWQALEQAALASPER